MAVDEHNESELSKLRAALSGIVREPKRAPSRPEGTGHLH